MDITQLIAAAPQAVFLIISLWFIRDIHKERIAENSRYAAALERLNELYVKLLERTISAIHENIVRSSTNGENIGRVDGKVTSLDARVVELQRSFERLVDYVRGRDSSN